jgi:hypothetical protein
MRDVTDLMQRYRECSRNLWNSYIGTAESDGVGEVVGRVYEQLRELLFKGIVTANLTQDESSELTLTIVPFQSLPILIERPSSDGNRYWDQEPDFRFEHGLVELTFVDLFDFFEGAIRDFRYYSCTVTKCPSHPEYEGRNALVDVVDARVLYAEVTEHVRP